LLQCALLLCLEARARQSLSAKAPNSQGTTQGVKTTVTQLTASEEHGAATALSQPTNTKEHRAVTALPYRAAPTAIGHSQQATTAAQQLPNERMERRSELLRPSSRVYASTAAALHNNKNPPQKPIEQRTGRTQVLGLNRALQALLRKLFSSADEEKRSRNTNRQRAPQQPRLADAQLE
jgi:hypothetical protein